jgi:hypothetical protein
VLSGAITPGQIERNLRAATLTVPVDLGVAESPADYWATRSRRPWN